MLSDLGQEASKVGSHTRKNFLLLGIVICLLLGFLFFLSLAFLLVDEINQFDRNWPGIFEGTGFLL